MRSVLVCGLGSVGSGIARAFLRAGWTCTSVDPFAAGADLRVKLEEISNDDFLTLVNVDEIVYAAEVGNRDEYARDPKIAEANKQRFSSFIERLAKVKQDVHVSYAGGSWTRREPKNFKVSDLCPAKSSEVANPYEIAKTEAKENAEALCKQHGVSISFWDWISVVPNFAPNFSISNMVTEACEKGKVTFSAGDYGRPLLHSEDAGRALVMVAEARLAGRGGEVGFEVILLPGEFTPFETFADVVVAEVGGVVKKLPQLETPEFLKTRCVGSQRLLEIGFVPNGDLVVEGLREACRNAIEEGKRR